MCGSAPAPEQAGVGVQQLAQVAQAARAREVALRKRLAGEGDAVRLVIMLPQPVDDLRCGVMCALGWLVPQAVSGRAG